MFNNATRRQVLKLAASAAAALLPISYGADHANQPLRVACFYQFDRLALDILSQPNGLPTGPQFLYVFAHSAPGIRARTEMAKLVHSAGKSFKYPHAFDLHNYRDWRHAGDEQLKAWATEFRKVAEESQADYFAFNEMPNAGPQDAGLRQRVVRLIRYLNDPGGGPALRGVFFFTESSLDPARWPQPDDDFWAAIDQTCDVVVAEQYHSFEFIMNPSVEKLSDYLFAMPKWRAASGKGPQTSIADRKLTVLHSSYYGPEISGWEGVQNGTHDRGDLIAYFNLLIGATRRSRFGRHRIGFGPLATKGVDDTMLTTLRDALVADLKR